MVEDVAVEVEVEVADLTAEEDEEVTEVVVAAEEAMEVWEATMTEVVTGLEVDEEVEVSEEEEEEVATGGAEMTMEEAEVEGVDTEVAETAVDLEETSLIITMEEVDEVVVVADSAADLQYKEGMTLMITESLQSIEYYFLIKHDLFKY